MLQLSAYVPKKSFVHTINYVYYNTKTIGSMDVKEIKNKDGVFWTIPTGPGLGVDVDLDTLGEPVMVFESHFARKVSYRY